MTASPAAAPAVSFVVIAYNEAPRIGRCLDALRALDGAADAEFICVDDCSRDATCAEVQRHAAADPRVRLLRHSRNAGRGAARDTGARAARADVLAFVDADIVLPRDWLQRARAFLAVGYDAGGGIAVPDGDATYLANGLGLVPRPVRPTTDVTGNNSIYGPRARPAMGIDPGRRNGEDIHIGDNLRAAGLRTGLIPGLHVQHLEDKGFAGTVHWLHESGRGAARLLVETRRVRPPDVAFAGFAVLTGRALVRLARRRLRPRDVAGPVAYVTAVAAAHLATRVRLSAPPGRLAVGLAANTVFIGAYMCGRVTGLRGRG